ncbi:hypothetical protein BSLG_007942 [Batrachochytrium salamandrivorans]|nr:hypothetical protein BASA81_010468 [Batrachochytrium salamandrivorans]KAJ1334787.1 hypothetical protein BSLG_007942 [Batrachochytrium salamandrivorans]
MGAAPVSTTAAPTAASLATDLPTPPSASPELRRMDTAALKQELADSLGPQHGPAYWAVFRSFLAGNCSKKEFDAVVLGALTGLQEPTAVVGPPTVHCISWSKFATTDFDLPSSYNSAGIPPPPGPPSTDFTPKSTTTFPTPIEISAVSIANSLKRTVDEDEELAPAEIKRRFTTNLIMSLSQQDRQRLIGLGIVKHQDEPFVPPTKKALFPNGFPVGIESIPRSCKDEGDIPVMDMLQQRLRFISGMQDLEESPTLESAKLISFALDHYLKNFLQAILRALTPLRVGRSGIVSGNNSQSAMDSLRNVSFQAKLVQKKRLPFGLHSTTGNSRTDLGPLNDQRNGKSISLGTTNVTASAGTAKPFGSSSTAPRAFVTPAASHRNTTTNATNGPSSSLAPNTAASQPNNSPLKSSKLALAPITSIEALEAMQRPFGLDELRFVFEFLPQMETETLERIALEAL